MANDTDQPASRAIGLAMIDLMREQQNEVRLYPLSGGQHMAQDGLRHRTRLLRHPLQHTDFWLANINAAENFGVTGWLDKTREAYADFLVSFCQAASLHLRGR